MFRYWQEKRNNEKGSILVYFALFLVVLIGFAAIALDGSNAYVQQRRAQDAADAAALAGARTLALGGSSSAIDSSVKQLAISNGAQNVTWQFIEGGKGVGVTTEISFETAFARVFGIETMTAKAYAEASFGAAQTAGNLLPMIAPCAEYAYGDKVRLWDKDSHSDNDGSGDDKHHGNDDGSGDDKHHGNDDGSGDDKHDGDDDGSGDDDKHHGDDDDDHDDEAPGNFGWLDWDGGSPSTPELAENIRHPEHSGSWSIGDWIPGGPGVKNSSQVIAALNTWIGKHVTIPLYDDVTGNGNNAQYHVCGFGEFVIIDYNFHGSDKYVEGYFVQALKPGSDVGPDHDYGVSLLHLSK